MVWQLNVRNMGQILPDGMARGRSGLSLPSSHRTNVSRTCGSVGVPAIFTSSLSSLVAKAYMHSENRYSP